MNVAAESMTVMRALYGPTARDLAQALPQIGESLAAVLASLVRDTTADGIDRAMISVEGVRQHLIRLQAALQQVPRD